MTWRFHRNRQLDKSVLADPRISEHYYQVSIQRDRSNFDTLTNAIGGRPKFKITRQKIKVNIAGFISLMSELLGHRLSAPEIEKLFNAVAKDYGRDDLTDTGLPDSPEAFAKAIHRERELWTSLLGGGQKIVQFLSRHHQ